MMNEAQVKGIVKLTILECSNHINNHFGTTPKYGRVIAEDLNYCEDEIANKITSKLKEVLAID